MKKALITGATGQDGSYLAEFLLDKEGPRHLIPHVLIILLMAIILTLKISFFIMQI